jgi:DNA-binding MarR family transcriptional regulator
MSIDKNLGIKSSFGYKLKKTQHILRLHMDETLRILDLTTPQYGVLAQLELKPGISNAALARAAFITSQTMHSIVSNLEKRGLVERKNDASHGRILCTELTERGREVVVLAHDIIRDCEARMLTNISEEHKTLLEKLLLECFNNLNSEGVD